jgi:RNA polymerase sigma-70 factor (ECF subfamily)
VSVTTDRATDTELLSRARAGERAALEELLERHQARVYRFGMKMCRDPEDAADVLQDTLLALARGVRDLRGASSVSTWLYSVARSFCIKKRRRSKFAPEVPSLELGAAGSAEVADPARSPDEVLASKRVEAALDHAIGALEPRYREVLILRDIENLTAPEVAEVLGISVQAVKSRLHRARLAVRDSVAPLLGLPSNEPASPGNCPDVLRLYSKHLEDEISSEVCSEMERHLNACPRCRGACESLKRTLALCRASDPGTAVPDSVQSAVKRALRDVLLHERS